MKRLTARREDGKAIYACSLRWEAEDEQVILDRLAELEDKIENKKMIELPAPLGSELWHIEMPSYKDSNGKSWTVCTYKGAKVKKLKYKLSLSNLYMVIDGHYFLTKEEAEAKLKEANKD